MNVDIYEHIYKGVFWAQEGWPFMLPVTSEPSLVSPERSSSSIVTIRMHIPHLINPFIHTGPFGLFLLFSIFDHKQCYNGHPGLLFLTCMSDCLSHAPGGRNARSEGPRSHNLTDLAMSSQHPAHCARAWRTLCVQESAGEMQRLSQLTNTGSIWLWPQWPNVSVA